MSDEPMASRESTWRRISVGRIVGAGLIALMGIQPAWAGPLDQYADEQVLRWLEDELEDLYLDYASDTDYPIGQLEEAVMSLLSDHPYRASPKHQAAHRYVSQAALEAEMAEAGTSVRAVVHGAILEADEMAALPGSTLRHLAQAGRGDGRTQARHVLRTVPSALVEAKSKTKRVS